jgi:pimeloyl-ACP methyl ester carboxylesterase
MPGMRAIVDAMPALVPGLRGSVTLPCGHWVPQEAPALVNDALLGFLRELD